MTKRSPYRVDTYCGCCHDTQAHYLRDEYSDEKRDCYECAKCLHLIFAPKGSGDETGTDENVTC